MTNNMQIQEVLAPLEGFPTNLFVREGLSPERGEDRMIPDVSRWDFTVSQGRIVDDRRPVEQKPDAASVSRFYDVSHGCYVVPAGVTFDFSCYFNMLAADKWRKLTYAEDFVLSLDIEGDADVFVYSYSLKGFASREEVISFQNKQRAGEPSDELVTQVLACDRVCHEKRATVDIALGSPEATLIGFAVVARADTRVYGGSWQAIHDEAHVNDIDLCVISTTFRKEEFIERNIQIIQDIAASDADVASHLQAIVVDNGQTLDCARLSTGAVRVVHNINAGGSGGFARGMIEALEQERRPSHLIIMDDDVVFLPECLKRTYALLRLLRPEFQDRFLSGAMMRYETRDVQHEDIGRIDLLGRYRPKKPAHMVSTIVDCAYSEVDWPGWRFEYAGWWYCCIPMDFVREDSLPIPVFVRGDDVEFSIRNNAKFITLNGISVWHMGFERKFSPQMECYQVIRNSFILKAMHPECDDVRFIDHVYELFGFYVSEFAYDYAALLLDAVEDYLQGPSILEECNGFEVLKEKAQASEVMRPLEEVWLGDADFGRIFSQVGERLPQNFIRRRLSEFTYNGHLGLESHVKDETGFIPYDWEFCYGAVYMKRRLVSVSAYECTAAIRERDQEKFMRLARRKLEVFDRYRNENDRVVEEYRKAFPRLTSIDFWKSYLSMDE